MNFVVVEGVITSEPRLSELPSGDVSVRFEVRTRSPGQRAQSIPIEWTGAPARRPQLGRDIEVAVIGTIHRRFYRAGGVLQSRVFVEPASITRQPARRRRAIERAVGELLDGLG